MDDKSLSSMEQRLQNQAINRNDCLAAIRGEAVPYALGPEITQFAVTRGIRHHPGFGTELRGALPVFTRALNAQNIMNDIIPDIGAAEEMPYCIWYPKTASEATYRELVRRYPAMVYHVGRACAVAGYLQLYQELDILPDVHIAEEARECGNLDIFNAIMSQPVRYSVMNDYELQIDTNNRQPAFLNGDTAVRRTLQVTKELPKIRTESHEKAIASMEVFDLFNNGNADAPITLRRGVIFNITEDFNVAEDHPRDEYDNPAPLHTKQWECTLPSARYLTEPLPADLPFIEKDLLILMAAYHGNIDRYVRLRRPKMIPKEWACCSRGIYHNTFFAVWWSKQPKPNPSYNFDSQINARFIMNNVLSRATVGSMPYVIWWPSLAAESTYRALVRLRPKDSIPSVVHACIVGGYVKLFDELLPQVTPTYVLIHEAKRQSNVHFREAIAARLDDLGMVGQAPSYPGHTYYATQCVGLRDGQVRHGAELELKAYVTTEWDGPYDGVCCDAQDIDVLACVPDDWKNFTNMEGDDWDYSEQYSRKLDYQRWPRGFWEALE